MSEFRTLIFAAFSLVVSILLIIIACVVKKPTRNAWPLMCLLLYFFPSVPFYLCGNNSRMQDDAFDNYDHMNLFNTIGLFIGGAAIVSGPGLAVVLYHTGVITTTAFVLTLISGFCFLLTWLSLFSQSRNVEDEIYDF